MNRIIFFVSVLLISSCDDPSYKVHSIRNNLDTLQVRFDFKARQSYPLRNKKMVEVVASLWNDRPDTLYFLGKKCDGDGEYFVYDHSKFEFEQIFLCDGSILVKKIPPKKHYTFKIHLQPYTNSSTIKLGYELNEVDKFFNPDKRNLYFIYQLRNHPILWTDEKDIDTSSSSQ